MRRGNGSDIKSPGERHDVLSGLVAAYADLELPPATALEVERHVAECAPCRRALRLHRAVRDRLRGETVSEVPAALRDRIFDAIGALPGRGDKRMPAPARTRLRLLSWGGAGALAAGLVLALVAGPWDRTGSVPNGLGSPRDSAAIRGLIQAHALAWNQRDAKAAVAVLTSDAVWITGDGVRLHGRAEIERAHVQWLAADSAAGGSTHSHPPETVAIRFLRPDVAIVDLEARFVPRGDGRPFFPERSAVFALAIKDGAEWRIAQIRNRGQPRS